MDIPFSTHILKESPLRVYMFGASPFVTLRLISLPCRFFYCLCDLRRGCFAIAILAHSSVLDISFLPLFSTLIMY